MNYWVILYFDNRMLNWLCPCEPSQDYSVVQEYPSIDALSFHNAHPSQEEDITMGHATQAETNEKINNQMKLLKPRREQDVTPNKEGFLSIGSLREGSAPNAVFRKIKKSRYQQILKDCARKKEKWTDPDFNYEATPPIARWARVTDFLPNATLMVHPVKPTVVKQGGFNNCYWMSSIAALAQREYRIRGLFESLEVSPWGVYMCRLLFDGVYQEVVVDDFFPINKQGSCVGAKPNLTDFWPLVLEKCWAKLHGSYHFTEYGYNNAALWALTASPVLGYFETPNIRNDSERSHRFFLLLKDHYERNHIINCSVDRQQLAQNIDLQWMHSYSILGVFETTFNGNNYHLLQIRNPLGFFGKGMGLPNLPFNYQDSFWQTITPEEKERLEYWRIEQAQGQGIFYVEWQDFLTCFNQVAIAQLDDNANYLYDTLPFHHYRPHYIALSVDSSDPLHLIVAQQTPLDPQKRVLQSTYGLVRVLVASVNYDSNNQPIYQYMTSKSLSNYEQTNYLDVDLSDLLPGKYLIRVSLLFDASSSAYKHKPVTIGYYGSGRFAVKPQEDVDDSDFLCRTLLSRAKKEDVTLPLRQPLKWAEGWSCIQTILDSNFGYIAFHVESGSQFEKYSITLDESKNQHGFFLEGHWTGVNTLHETIRRGEEILIPYSYAMFMPSIDRFPTFADPRKKPVVSFQPLFQ